MPRSESASLPDSRGQLASVKQQVDGVDRTNIHHSTYDEHDEHDEHDESNLVILMCGPAGSGKSYLSIELQRQGMTRLSIDEVAWECGMYQHPLSAESIAELHALLQHRLLEAVDRGEDVVVDSSFWSRRSRDDYRLLPYSRPVRVEVWYLRTSEPVLRARVARRTNSGPHDVALTQEVLTGFLASFEVPTVDEGPLRVIECE